MSPRYLSTRIAQAVFVLWAAFTLAFVLLQMMPGDGILIKFMESGSSMGLEKMEAIRNAYGADQPVLQRYWRSVTDFLSGNFGYSIYLDTPVAFELAKALPPTLRLAALAFAFAAMLSVVLALVASLTRFRWLHDAISALPGLFVSLPVFWLAIVLIQLVSFQLGWISIVEPGPVEAMILPVLTLSVPMSAPLTQVLLGSIESVRAQPFIQVARAKGAGELRILVTHVLRNAALPTLTIAGVLFGELVAGTVVTETVFGLQGLGRLTFQAVHNQDAPILQAVVVFAAAGFVLINLTVDILMLIVDPRLLRTANS